jgi:TolA-binding protein
MHCAWKNSLMVLGAGILLFSGCTYYNTFYNAKKAFKEGEEAQEKAAPSRRAMTGRTQYEEAIKKASKVLTFHPKSKWADDALFMIGRAYFNMEEYVKAGRKFEELLVSFPKSKLADDSRYYISLCHYYSGEEARAIKQLKDFLDSKKMGKRRKAEASFLLAQMNFDREDYPEAKTYYEKTINEFDPDTLSAITQFQIGECLWQQKEYERAKEAFVKVEKLKPSSELFFGSRFRQGECWYLLNDHQKGMEIFQELSEDERFSDRLAPVMLKMAEADYHLGELCLSMVGYYEAAEKYPKTEESTEAYFQLGEIYQNLFGSLEEAKKVFDASSREKRDSPVAKEALTRSANISRIQEYYQELSEEDAQESGKSLFLLGELYLTQMHQPDSALGEYLSLVEQFPNSEYAAKSLYAAAWVTEKVKKDSAGAAGLYQRILDEYPQSDYRTAALEFLHTTADTIDLMTPQKAYMLAERFLLEDKDLDSALTLFDLIITQFPYSNLAGKSAFAKAWAIEQYANPGDSTAIFAYQEVIDQYDESEYAEESRIRLGLSQRARPVAPAPREATPLEEEIDSTMLEASPDTSGP